MLTRIASLGLAGLLLVAPAAIARPADGPQAPRGEDIQAPRMQDVQAPRDAQASRDGGQDVQAPRGAVADAPRL